MLRIGGVRKPPKGHLILAIRSHACGKEEARPGPIDTLVRRVVNDSSLTLKACERRPGEILAKALASEP